MKCKFSENNSGGHWWLKRAQYDALMAAGWRYKPSKYDLQNGYDTKGWGNGDDVPYGWRRNLVGDFPSLRAAVESFERATGEDFFEQGCNCCGAPFSISGGEGKDWDYISGDSVEREPIRPW